MNLQKREFKEDYDKAAFYSIMGEFFCRKKIPGRDAYLVNTEERNGACFSQTVLLQAFMRMRKGTAHGHIRRICASCLPSVWRRHLHAGGHAPLLPHRAHGHLQPQAHRYAGRKRVSPPFPPGQLYYHGKLIPDYPYIQQRKQKRKQNGFESTNR